MEEERKWREEQKAKEKADAEAKAAEASRKRQIKEDERKTKCAKTKEEMEAEYESGDSLTAEEWDNYWKSYGRLLPGNAFAPEFVSNVIVRPTTLKNKI